MEKIYEQTLLYDFYGELLTEHQKRIYEDAVYNDMSLGEIAQEQGISRQGVHDLIRRCDKILQGYEERMHLVERFTQARDRISQIESLTSELLKEGAETGDAADGNLDRQKLEQIRRLAGELMDTL